MIDMILYDIAEDASANGLCVCVCVYVGVRNGTSLLNKKEKKLKF